MKHLGAISSFLIVVVFSLLAETYVNGPATLTMKYDLEGNPISALPKLGFAIFFFHFLLLTNGLILLIRKYFGSDPSLQWVNIPNKEYWLLPENAQEGLWRLRALLDGVLIFVNLLSITVLLLIRLQVRGAPVNIVLMLVVIWAALLLIWTHRLFRPQERPNSTEASEHHG